MAVTTVNKKLEVTKLGMYIDLCSYDKNLLINELAKHCKTEDKELIETIMSKCGTFFGDKYVILSQDCFHDYNCLFVLSNVLDEVFNVDDTLQILFDCKREKMIATADEEEVMQELFEELKEDNN